MAWNYDPSQYEEKTFELIPAGDHRARITNVVERGESNKFNSGSTGYEITLKISGYPGSVWFYLVLNPDDPQKTNQRIGSFFDSFGITDRALTTGQSWVGKVGAVRIKHDPYNGGMTAKVAFPIGKKGQEKMPPWKEVGGTTAAATPQYAPPPTDDGELPF